MSGAAFHAYMTKWTGYKGAFYMLAVMCVVGLILLIPIKDGFVERYEAKFAAEDNK